MKADDALLVSVIGYSEKLNYHNLDDLVISVRSIKDSFLYVGIDSDRIVLGFANKKGQIEEKHKFKTDGVYIQLFRGSG